MLFRYYTWYAASQGDISVTDASGDGQITTQKSELGAMNLVATWGSQSNLGKIELSHNSASAGSAGDLTTYAVNSAGILVPASVGSTNVLYGSAVVTLGYEGAKTKDDYAADGTLSGNSAIVYVRVDGGSIEHLNSAEAAVGTPGAQTAVIKATGIQPKTN